jgi:hypothetical protein
MNYGSKMNDKYLIGVALKYLDDVFDGVAMTDSDTIVAIEALKTIYERIGNREKWNKEAA